MEKARILNNRYQILHLLGTGGMAQVYQAHDNFLNRQVAIKIIKEISPIDDLNKERFFQEIKAVSRVKHHNVVSVYDVFIDDKDCCLVFELLEGKSLKEHLKNTGILGVIETVDIIISVLKGVEACHKVGIIHRDLKPDNIVLVDNGAIKVLDFGIAIIDNYEIKKHANQIIGTMKYIAPEVVKFQQPTIQSDIYALGIILYELLTGIPPFFHKNLQILASKHIKEPMPLIRNLNPEIPQSLENIIIKATNKNPKNRYSNINDFIIDLKTSLNESRKQEKRNFKKKDIIILQNQKKIKLLSQEINSPFYLKKWFLLILILIMVMIITIVVILLI